jgi:hypothetical protein
MTEFEARLHECLEALSEGRWDLDECLRRNPEHAAALRPMLLAATMTAQAYDARPRTEFAAAARERFLIATGQRLRETMDVEPAPAFFAAARLRFLLAARRMKLGEGARQPRHVPVFGSPFRALAGGMAAVVIMLGASTYTVATASAALPGDWQYPIKLQTERVRVALAFGDDAKLNVKLDIAEERVSEIEQLTKRGKIIGPGVLDRLVEQTQPLIDDARDGGWQPDEAARLEQVSEKQQEVLQLASAQVAPEAQDRLSAAVNVSQTGEEVSKRILFFADPARPPMVLTPSVALEPSATPTEAPAASPTAAPTEASSSAPEASSTAAGPPAPPASVAAPTTRIVFSAAPAETRNGVKLFSVTAGSLTFLAPGSSDGWKLVDAPSSGVPALIRFANQDDTSLMIINTSNGDMYWYINQNGHFDEVQMRMKKERGVFVADRDVLRTGYSDASDVPWYVMQSIALIPPPPAPTATASATASATATETPVPPATASP